LGGDEFVAILVDLETPKDCEPVLKRLLASVSEPVEIEKITLHVSASVGVSIAPQDANEGDQLIRQADQAMYQAKQSGKNRFHLFDAKKDSAIVALHENLLRIKKALDNHEFVLYYQPKVNLQTNEIIGAEALIRWIDPQRGIIPPLKFLPIVENDPMSIDIGEWVIDTALSEIAIWKEAGVTMAVSVNIGALQLQDKNFVARLKELLNAHPEVEPHLLELEILETSIVSDLAKVTKVIDQCIELGVFCALDDFGTGYSSLTHIRHLHVNMIKIDQTFVRDMLVDSDDLAIVEGVIGLAKAFKRDVIAEGVESRELGEALLELGCTLAQGYGIARPMPASEMLQWIQNWREKNSWK
jgi:predicted signal transduction protein with EAL and GGDEF domain